MPTARLARFTLEALEAREVPSATPFGPLTSAGTFATGVGAVDVKLADFNGDGHLDAAVVNTGFITPLVSILPGNGDGTFGAAQQLASLSNLGQALTLGDFNEDGRVDIAAVSYATNQVVVHLNTSTQGGAITFGTGATFGTFIFPTDIATADINGDGHLDLVVANDFLISTLLLGVGDGTFNTAQSVPGSSASQRVAVADFDGDGLPDVLLTGTTGGGVVLRNVSGNLSIVPGTTISTSAVVLAVATGDFNGDGRADIVVTEDGGTVRVFLNTSASGSISFAAGVTYSFGSNPTDVAVADVNLDGELDLVVTADLNSSVELLTGVGDGTFVPGGFADSVGVPGPLALGDLDGDGDLEAVVALLNTGEIEVFMNTTPVPVPPAPPAPPTGATFGSSSGNGSVRVLNADGTTRFLFNPYPGFTGPVAAAVGDVTGDGTSDVFTAARGTVSVFDGATGARFEGQPFVGYTGAIALAAGDLTGDGVIDVALTAVLNGNTMVFNGATGTLVAQFNAFEGHTGPVELAIGDLNGDGANELVAVARRPAGLQVNVYDIANLRVLDALTLAAPGGDRFSVAVTDPASGPGNLVISSGGTVAVIDTQARAVRALFDLNATVPDVELDIMGDDILVSAPLGGRTGVMRVSGSTFDVLGTYFADEPPLVG